MHHKIIKFQQKINNTIYYTPFTLHELQKKCEKMNKFKYHQNIKNKESILSLIF